MKKMLTSFACLFLFVTAKSMEQESDGLKLSSLPHEVQELILTHAVDQEDPDDAAVTFGQVKLVDSLMREIIKSPKILNSIAQQYLDDDSIAAAHIFRQASARGLLQIVNAFIKAGIDIDALDRKKNSALMHAILAGQAEVVELLVNHSSDINAFNQEKNTPLMMAASSGNREIARILLNHRASVHHPDTCGNTALLYALKNGHTQLAQNLIEHGAQISAIGLRALLLESLSPDLVSLLVAHSVCEFGSTSTAATKILTSVLLDDVEQVKLNLNPEALTSSVRIYPHVDGLVSGITPLMLAAALGNTAMVELLLAYGANINMQCLDKSEHIGGKTALIFAAHNGHAQVVQLLIERGASVDHRDVCKRSALSYASQKGHLETAKILMSHITDSAHIREAFYMPLNSNLEVIKLFCDQMAIDGSDECQQYLVRALITAVQYGSQEAVKLLIDYGAHVNSYFKGCGYGSALATAAACGNLAMVEVLLDSGADVNGISAGAVSDSNQPRNNFCHNALLWAAKEGHAAIVELLINRKADLSVKTEYGTPLLFAAQYGHKKVVKILLAHGVSVNERNCTGDTALHNAAQINAVGIVKLLLKHNADPRIKNSREETARAIARWQGYEKIMRLLPED